MSKIIHAALFRLFLFVPGILLSEEIQYYDREIEFYDQESYGVEEEGRAWSLGGSVEAIFWSAGDPPAGLIAEGGEGIAPRLALELDFFPNDRWYAHATARADRGFDPFSNSDGEVRIDEAFIRFRPFGDSRLNIQIGKSATVFGSWVNGHAYADDPFLTAPLPYRQIIGIGVQNPQSLSPQAILDRATGAAPGVFETSNRIWASTIWGPSYTTGISAFGNAGGWDYGLEIKNSGLSSNPEEWNPELSQYEDPTFTGRIGYRPNAAWSFGGSASRGPYLETSAEEFLPAGVDRGDLPYTIVGLDARWARRDWVISAEAVGAQYETLQAGDLRSLSYSLQARWKMRPGIWLAGRFGQTFNNEARGPGGVPVEFSPDIWRIGFAVGWRVSPELLMKAEYNFTRLDDSRVSDQNLFGLGLNYRF